MRAPTEPGHAGYERYTPTFLGLYDPLVLGLFCHMVWRCPARRLRDHYRHHIGRRHLDVGPGTGYFLRHARVPAGAEITLLDANVDVLRYAGRRLAHLHPHAVQADALGSLPAIGPFDSVGLCFVLHCLPVPMPAKADVIARLSQLVMPDGRLFGATIVADEALHTRLSRLFLRINNCQGVFHNRSDHLADLRAALERSFGRVEVETVGSVAVFNATAPLVHRRRGVPAGVGATRRFSGVAVSRMPCRSRRAS